VIQKDINVCVSQELEGTGVTDVFLVTGDWPNSSIPRDVNVSKVLLSSI